MHLKSLTLRGFKSFASVTTLKFEPGICAVVGPNGSGKSNVVDALAWVMGEQGAKTLRGGKMQDVIFAGAGDRKPLGRAEVTLTIDNSDGALPIDYSEVSITRRMFRDGASEYEINGSKARLMDIQELLSDSGIGREMHVIVGQGRLAQILESRPEERRAFIEEAAGVLKHRRRKEKAQRKLVGMQANLDRLQDLTDELRKQLKPLARQAQAAQRAQTVQATLRDARLRLAGDRVHRLRLDFDDADRRAHLLKEQVSKVTAVLEEASAEQLEIETVLETLTPEADAAQQLWFTLSTLAERVSATARIAAERSANADVVAYTGPDPEVLERRAKQADEEMAALAEAVEIAAERLESIRDEVFAREEARREAEAEHMAQVRAIADRREGVVRLIATEESLAGQVRAVENEIARHGETLADTLERTQAAQREAEEAAGKVRGLQGERAPLEDAHIRAASEAGAADKRLDQLRDEQRGRERVVYSLQSRIDTLRQNVPVATADLDWPGLAELIRTKHGRAVSAALGPHAEGLVGVVDEGVVEKLDGAARTVLIEESASGDPWRMDAILPAGVSWLLDHIDIDARITRTLHRLLADVALAPDLATARATIDTDPRLRAVTPDGMLCGEGWLQAGHGAVSPVEVGTQIADAEKDLLQARSLLEQLAGTLEGARIAAEEARVDAAAKKAALREHDQAAISWERDLARVEKQYEANRGEHRRAAEQATVVEARLAELRHQLNEARDRLSRVEDIDTVEEPSTLARDEANTALAQVRAMEMEATLALRTAQERASQAAGQGEGLRRQAAQERQAKARHEEIMRKRRETAELAAVVQRGALDVAARVADAAERAASRRDELARQRTELVSRLAQARDRVHAARQQLGRSSESAHAGDIARTQAQVRVDESEAKISEQLGLAITDLMANYTPGADFDRAEEEKRLTQAERDLRALGKVNPLALEEFTALEERYEFLSTQLDDVIRARADLSGVIDEVDTRILQLFTEAWVDVAEQFPQVFQTLFPGGEGRLLLTDPEDMLATGIEIEARPPGKKVRRLSLLSGGEKSLTALALLVAIFQARPSPFYVMDEVEAALDDVNLRRLIALFEDLRRDSQLIVITHQKPTMDVANVLYGVTMRGDGITRVISQRMSPAPSLGRS